MSVIEGITISVSVVSAMSALVAIFFAVKNGKRTDVKDIEDRVARDTKIDMKLDDISEDTKDIRETVKNIQNDVKDHEGRIVKLEASYKAEHKRLDEVFRMANIKEVE